MGAFVKLYNVNECYTTHAFSLFHVSGFSITAADAVACFATAALSREWFYVGKVILLCEYVILVKTWRRQLVLRCDMGTKIEPGKVCLNLQFNDYMLRFLHLWNPLLKFLRAVFSHWPHAMKVYNELMMNIRDWWDYWMTMDKRKKERTNLRIVLLQWKRIRRLV